MSKSPPKTSAERQATYRAKDNPKKVDLSPKTRTLLSELHRRTGWKIDTLIFQAFVALTKQLPQEVGGRSLHRTGAAAGHVEAPPDPGAPRPGSSPRKRPAKQGRPVQGAGQSPIAEVRAADTDPLLPGGTEQPRDGAEPPPKGSAKKSSARQSIPSNTDELFEGQAGGGEAKIRA